MTLACRLQTNWTSCSHDCAVLLRITKDALPFELRGD